MSIEIDAVVFDLGGVFTDSPFQAMQAMADDKGVAFDELLMILFGSYHADTDHPWHQAERGELEVAAARKAIRDLALERGLEVDLYEMLQYMGRDGGIRHQVVEVARRVRKDGLATGLVTNNVAEFREFWRPLLPLDELFDVVIDSSEVGMRKPDPRIYHLVLEQLGGIAPERSVFLDDFEGNVIAAREVGMHGIVVDVDPADALAELEGLLAPQRP